MKKVIFILIVLGLSISITKYLTGNYSSLDEDFSPKENCQKLADYVNDNPNIPIDSIARKIGIQSQTLQCFVKCECTPMKPAENKIELFIEKNNL